MISAIAPKPGSKSLRAERPSGQPDRKQSPCSSKKKEIAPIWPPCLLQAGGQVVAFTPRNDAQLLIMQILLNINMLRPNFSD